MLMFTSGTTGRSKGVMLSEKNYFTACQMYIDGRRSSLIRRSGWHPRTSTRPSALYAGAMFHLAGFICYFVYGIQAGP